LTHENPILAMSWPLSEALTDGEARALASKAPRLS
jgi:hypothetical protein